MARFAAPPPSQRVPRFRAPGLGGVGQPIATDTEDPATHELEETTPSEGFSGYHSRSRFGAPVGQITFGHGAAQERGDTPQGDPQGYDPGTGRSRFNWPWSVKEHTELPERAERMATLGTAGVGDPAVRFFRRRINTTVGPFQLQDPNAMGWGLAPFPRAIRQPRFTLRREFRQGAQSFSGLHTLVVKYGKASTSPARMGSVRTSRLTRRSDPGSFGQQAQVLNAR